MDPAYGNLSLSRNSSRYCQKIVIEQSASVFNDASPWQSFKLFINSFEFSLTEVVDASENSCSKMALSKCENVAESNQKKVKHIVTRKCRMEAGGAHYKMDTIFLNIILSS
jgi:hypothetical protein